MSIPIEHFIFQSEQVLDNDTKIPVEYVYEKQKYIMNGKPIWVNDQTTDIPIDKIDITYDKKTMKYILQGTTNNSHYNGWNNRTSYGYHSFQMNNLDIIGQRQPYKRINYMRQYLDFTDKTLIDFGCNTGGMIFHLPELKQAYGMDFDGKCIDVCNKISHLLKYKTVHNFECQDLNYFDFSLFLTKRGIEHIDVIFLLSLGSWITNWRLLYEKSFQYAKYIVLETNNDEEGKPQLELFRSFNANINMISDASIDDITKNVGRKTYLISKRLKIYIPPTNFHFKNAFFISKLVEKYYTKVNEIENANIVYSPSTYIDIHKYPKQKFVFGPHFSVFPNDIVRKFQNIHQNGLYIQPSQPSVDTWQNEFGFQNLPMKAIPFGVDTARFSVEDNLEKQRTNVMLYYKQRDPNEYKMIVDFLNGKGIQYKLFSYDRKYAEEDFLSYAKTCKYAIILGRHESQGFALHELMSCNVPLFVWGVTLRKQEYPYNPSYMKVKSNVSTVPYWSTQCGEIFYEFQEIEPTFSRFLENLPKYKPRQFILDNTSIEACYKKWNDLFVSMTV